MRAREYWLLQGPDFRECKTLSVEAAKAVRNWCKYLLHYDLETETAAEYSQKDHSVDK